MKKVFNENKTKKVITKYNDCIYPDWEGGLIYDEHHFDKDGYCVICGNSIEQTTINVFKIEENDNK